MSGQDSKMPSKPEKKKKGAIKFRKAPQAPKRGKSAFILFSMAKHPQMRKQLDNGSSEKTTNVAKRVSEAWRNLGTEERAIWDEKARLDKMRYESEKTFYTGPWRLPSGPKRAKKDPDAPKRPMSAFLSYSKMMRSQVQRGNPNMKNVDVSKVLAKMWKTAPESDRKMHIDQEAKDRAIYKVAMDQWRRARDEEIAAERKHREDFAMDAIARGSGQAVADDTNTQPNYSMQQASHDASIRHDGRWHEGAMPEPCSAPYIHTDHGSHSNNAAEYDYSASSDYSSRSLHFPPNPHFDQQPSRAETNVAYSPVAAQSSDHGYNHPSEGSVPHMYSQSAPVDHNTLDHRRSAAPANNLYRNHVYYADDATNQYPQACEYQGYDPGAESREYSGGYTQPHYNNYPPHPPPHP